MATYQYSVEAAGDEQIDFDPAVDVLNFDQASIRPVDVFLVRDENAGGDSALDLNVAVIDGPRAGDHVFLLDMDKRSVTTTNFTFAAGGSIFVGDNTTGIAADNDANTHIGTDFADLFIGMGGNDTLTGGGGNDVFAFYLSGGGRYGMDVITGGAGTDTLRFLDEGAVGAQVNLISGTVSGGDADGTSGATVSGVEWIAGTIFADNFTGNAFANLLHGRDGDDTLRGAAGSDTLEGGAGGDHLNGGDGRDWADYQHSAAGVTINIGAGGSDGMGGTDVLVNVEDFIGSVFADNVTGSLGGNVIDLRGGRDVARGGGGNDTLFGGVGADNLRGGEGDDVIYGHAGNDIYSGDRGNDTIVGSGASAFISDGVASVGQDMVRVVAANQQKDYVFAFDTDTMGGVDTNVDVIDMRTFLNAVGYTGSDPIGDGWMMIQDTAGSGRGAAAQSDAVVYVDPDGGGDSWVAVLQIVDVSSATLTSNPDFFLFQ
jgi:Ca2+-binding RTX toxin-like protein